MSLVSIQAESGVALAHAAKPAIRSYPGKRLFDLVAAVLLIVFFAPAFALIALALKISVGGPVFFRQRRLGAGGVEFGCWKFRTMRPDSAAVLAELLRSDPFARAEWQRSQKLTNDPRVHRLGRLLRISNVDELPQLFNVARGEMSMVGPRPITAEEASRYGEHYEAYKAMRPGLTGIWQVLRTSATSYDERVRMDVDYFDRASAGLDFSLMAATAVQVLRARGSG